MNFAVAEQKLKEIGQEHVLKYYDELSDDEKNALLDQIENTDFSVLSHVNDDAENMGHGVYSPLKAVTRDEIEKRYDEFTAKGIETIKAGKTAALLLAGGMGTRLGSDNPKGMYDIGLTKHVYIFQRIIENLLDTVHAADTWIYLFIMTSEKNDTATRTFMKEHDYFGYNWITSGSSSRIWRQPATLTGSSIWRVRAVLRRPRMEMAAGIHRLSVQDSTGF